MLLIDLRLELEFDSRREGTNRLLCVCLSSSVLTAGFFLRPTRSPRNLSIWSFSKFLLSHAQFKANLHLPMVLKLPFGDGLCRSVFPAHETKKCYEIQVVNL